MIFKYRETKLEDGYYILEINGKRTVAEYYSGLDAWNQIGADYDTLYWEDPAPEIKVIAKIHLDDCTITEM